MSSIIGIFRPSVGNQKFAVIAVLRSDVWAHIEVTSLTAGLHPIDLDGTVDISMDSLSFEAFIAHSVIT